MSNPPEPRPNNPQQQGVTYSRDNPTPIAVGAPFYPKPSGRPMKYFPITEAELHAISILNGVCSTFIGLSCAMLTLSIGFIWDLWLDDTAPQTGAKILPLVFLILTAVCMTIAFVAGKQKKSELDKIIESCQEIELPFAPKDPGTAMSWRHP